MNARCIVVSTPYLDEANTAEAEYLVAKGFTVLDIQGLNLSTGTGTEMGQAAGKPVITSNQAQFWSCLRRAGIADRLSGFGGIFDNPGTGLLPV